MFNQIELELEPARGLHIASAAMCAASLILLYHIQLPNLAKLSFCLVLLVSWRQHTRQYLLLDHKYSVIKLRLVPQTSSQQQALFLLTLKSGKFVHAKLIEHYFIGSHYLHACFQATDSSRRKLDMLISPEHLNPHSYPFCLSKGGNSRAETSKRAAQSQAMRRLRVVLHNKPLLSS